MSVSKLLSELNQIKEEKALLESKKSAVLETYLHKGQDGSTLTVDEITGVHFIDETHLYIEGAESSESTYSFVFEVGNILVPCSLRIDSSSKSDPTAYCMYSSLIDAESEKKLLVYLANFLDRNGSVVDESELVIILHTLQAEIERLTEESKMMKFLDQSGGIVSEIEEIVQSTRLSIEGTDSVSVYKNVQPYVVNAEEKITQYKTLSHLNASRFIKSSIESLLSSTENLLEQAKVFIDTSTSVTKYTRLKTRYEKIKL